MTKDNKISFKSHSQCKVSLWVNRKKKSFLKVCWKTITNCTISMCDDTKPTDHSSGNSYMYIVHRAVTQSSASWQVQLGMASGCRSRCLHLPRRRCCCPTVPAVWTVLSWQTADTSRDASVCRSAAGPHRMYVVSAISCWSWRSLVPENRGSPDIQTIFLK